MALLTTLRDGALVPSLLRRLTEPIVDRWPGLLFAGLSGVLSFRDRAGNLTLTGSGAVRYQAASGARINLAKNPSFETNTTGWTLSGVSVASDATWAASGSKSGKITVTAVGMSSAIFTDATGATMIPVTVGQDYVLSAYVFNPAATARSCRLGIVYRDRAGNTKNTFVSGYTEVPAGGVVRLTRTGAPAAGSDAAYVIVYADNAGPNPFVNGDMLYVDGVQFETGTTPTPYVDGSSLNAAWLDPITGILGTAHASPSVSRAAAWVEEGTTNLLINPSAEHATVTTGAAATGGATLTKDTAFAFVGAASFKLVTPNSTVGEGIQLTTATGLGYTGSARTFKGKARLRGVAGTVQARLRVLYTDASGLSGSYTSHTLTDGWSSVEIAATVTTDSAKTVDFIALQIWTDVQQGITFYVDAAQVEEKAYATSYCDGSLGTGYSWSGTAHASSSTRAATTLKADETGRIDSRKGSVVLWVNRLIDTAGIQSFFSAGALNTAAKDWMEVRLDVSDQVQLVWQTNNGSVMAATVAGGTSVNTWYMVGAKWNGTSMAVRRDLGAWVTATRNAPTGDVSSANDVSIGSRNTNIPQANALVSSPLVLDREITDMEYARLHALGPAGVGWDTIRSSD